MKNNNEIKKIFSKNVPNGDNIIYIIVLISLGLSFKFFGLSNAWWEKSMSVYQVNIFSNFCIILGVFVFIKFFINFKFWMSKKKLKYKQFNFLYILAIDWIILLLYFFQKEIKFFEILDFLFSLNFLIFPVWMFFSVEKFNRIIKHYKYYKK